MILYGTWLSLHVSHSTKGEEFLCHAQILEYFFSSSNILLLEVCLLKLVDYLTFTTVIGTFNTDVHSFSKMNEGLHPL